MELKIGNCRPMLAGHSYVSHCTTLGVFTLQLHTQSVRRWVEPDGVVGAFVISHIIMLSWPPCCHY